MDVLAGMPVSGLQMPMSCFVYRTDPSSGKQGLDFTRRPVYGILLSRDPKTVLQMYVKLTLE